MAPKAKSVKNYNFTAGDKLFLDANIWLYLHGPQQPRAASYVKTYSDAYKRMLSAQSQIYIDVLIVSEFVNRYARLQHKFAASGQNFKAFRNSPAFKKHAQDIADDVKRVLRHCSRIESGFATLKIIDLLDDFAAGGSDFNDQVIAALCRRMGLTLVTHDSDFNAPGISVLTANQSLLV